MMKQYGYFWNLRELSLQLKVILHMKNTIEFVTLTFMNEKLPFTVNAVVMSHRIPVLTDWVFLFVCLLAVVDLNGRYFGGRVVKACFYNLDKFRVLDLAEQV